MLGCGDAEPLLVAIINQEEGSQLDYLIKA